MSVTNERESARSAYIRKDGDSGVDKPRILHKRRKASIVSLLAEFEREIEPLLPPDCKQAVEHFKRSCRSKLNGITFEAVELMRLAPGEHLNEHAVDLAETFGATTED